MCKTKIYTCVVLSLLLLVVGCGKGASEEVSVCPLEKPGVVILWDRSESVSPEDRERLEGFLTQADGSVDLALIAFGEQVEVIVEKSEKTKDIQKAVETLEPKGNTHLQSALTWIEEEVDPKHSVMVWTDLYPTVTSHKGRVVSCEHPEVNCEKEVLDQWQALQDQGHQIMFVRRSGPSDQPKGLQETICGKGGCLEEDFHDFLSDCGA